MKLDRYPNRGAWFYNSYHSPRRRNCSIIQHRCGWNGRITLKQQWKWSDYIAHFRQLQYHWLKSQNNHLELKNERNEDAPKTKLNLCLSPPANQHWNPCSGFLCTSRHGWPVKKPLFTCQSGWRKIRNKLLVIRWVCWGPRTRTSALIHICYKPGLRYIYKASLIQALR